jgi:hypothetical protein
MPAPAHYRRIHRLLLNPGAAVLVTTSGGRYLIDRSVLVCVSGPAVMPTISGILSGLPDGVYKVHATLPPRPQPNLQPVPDAIESALWIAPGILEALIPGRMQSHACTAEVSR